MTFTIIRHDYGDPTTAVHANGQAKLDVDYIPDAFNEEVEVNKAKVLAMEHDLGIKFNKREALS